MISSGQPAVNPRLLKEADSLCKAGYQVTVIYAYWNAWATTFDAELIPQKKWKAIRAAGDPDDKRFIYFLSKVIYRAAKWLNKLSSGKWFVNQAIARPAFFLRREAKRHIADLYIAHNLAALPAAVAAAQKHGKPCGFDAEDFHRHEVSDHAADLDVVLKSAIEDKYFKRLNYFTTSSPQIADAYSQIYPNLKPVVILNVFENKATKPKAEAKGPVKLFWFSQTIGPNRGIGDVVAALQQLNRQDFELHLLGNKAQAEQSFFKELLASGINFTFHEPVHPDELTSFAAQFDIGLALEPGFSINNNLALSNKIFTYMQAGLAVVASNTPAQQALMTQNPGIGKVYPIGDVSALANILSAYHHNRSLLVAAQNGALRLAHEQYNWQLECRKFLTVVEQTLNS